ILVSGKFTRFRFRPTRRSAVHFLPFPVNIGEGPRVAVSLPNDVCVSLPRKFFDRVTSRIARRNLVVPQQEDRGGREILAMAGPRFQEEMSQRCLIMEA